MILQHGVLPEEQDAGGALQVSWLCGTVHKLVCDTAGTAASCSLRRSREHLLSSWNTTQGKSRASQGPAGEPSAQRGKQMPLIRPQLAQM